MNQKSSAPAAQGSATAKAPDEQVVRDIRRSTRKQYSAEEKIRIVLEGLRGEESIAGLCRREGIAESLYYTWSKEFLDAGKRRPGGDHRRGQGPAPGSARPERGRRRAGARAAVAEKSMIADGADPE
jgi:transposase